MDVRQLRHFIAVADTLHFGRAAELLGMTQPPLSQSIMALERELGAPLFTRSKRSVALTEFGQQWIEHVRPAVEEIAALPEVARRLLSGTTGRVSLSFVSTADYSVLPRLVQDYAAAYPDVEIALAEATTDVQITALVEGTVDAGILIPTHPALPAVLDYMPLLKEPLVAAVPDAWIDDGCFVPDGGLIRGDAWMTMPLIMFPARVSPDFHKLVLDFYHSRNRQPTIRQEAIQMQTIISLVSAGIGMALVPASMQHLARTGVRYIPIAEQPPLLETGLAWRAANEAPTLRSLIEIARTSRVEPFAWLPRD